MYCERWEIGSFVSWQMKCFMTICDVVCFSQSGSLSCFLSLDIPWTWNPCLSKHIGHRMRVLCMNRRSWESTVLCMFSKCLMISQTCFPPGFKKEPWISKASQAAKSSEQQRMCLKIPYGRYYHQGKMQHGSYFSCKSTVYPPDRNRDWNKVKPLKGCYNWESGLNCCQAENVLCLCGV